MAPLVFKAGGRKLIVMHVRPDSVPVPSTAPATPPTQAAEANKPETPTERNQMTKTTNRIEQHQSEQPAKQSSFEQLQEQIEQIKTTLKAVVGQLNEASRTVAQAFREKRASEKEIESIRDSLKEIQSIHI
jgi:septal ring factor EnvC (AmiA/AmiB activator)